MWLRAENMKLSGHLIMITSSMEFSRQEYWGTLAFPTLGDLLDPGIESASLTSSALTDSLPLHKGKGEVPPSCDYSANIY